MNSITLQRCAHHPDREAAARCPECGRFFCRECITEHDERVICADCLAKLSQPAAPGPGRNFAPVLRLFQCGAAILTAWVFFYLVGRVLLSIPAAIHEGTLWQMETKE